MTMSAVVAGEATSRAIRGSHRAAARASARAVGISHRSARHDAAALDATAAGRHAGRSAKREGQP